MLELQTFQTASADFEQEVVLNGQLVTLRITWNTRVEYFFLLFTDSDGVSLGQIKMTERALLFRPHNYLINFKGDFLVLPKTQNVGTEIKYDELGNDWGLYYLDEKEVESWVVENGL